LPKSSLKANIIMKNNFEALMPMIAKYVFEHPEEYETYLKEKQSKEISKDIDTKEQKNIHGETNDCK